MLSMGTGAPIEKATKPRRTLKKKTYRFKGDETGRTKESALGCALLAPDITLPQMRIEVAFLPRQRGNVLIAGIIVLFLLDCRDLFPGRGDAVGAGREVVQDCPV